MNDLKTALKVEPPPRLKHRNHSVSVLLLLIKLIQLAHFFVIFSEGDNFSEILGSVFQSLTMLLADVTLKFLS